jgi:putative flavoprotein involved in K+ transport
MKHTETIIIGGGQAGLAMSYSLAEQGIEHVVLERGQVAHRWLTERWDSLKLLTPNWQTRLPGYRYRGTDPEGFMTAGSFAAFLANYARGFSAPVETETSVHRVERDPDGYRVRTNRGTWTAPNVVIATGESDVPRVPRMMLRMAPWVEHVIPSRYRNPSELPDAGVLVVGASATGVQLAHEIHQSGRPVTLAVGRHTRLPRTYRGKDIFWWLEELGILDERAEDVRDLEASRRQPSLQLVGREDRMNLDLKVLRDEGIRLVGRAVNATDGRVRIADNLRTTTAAADAKLVRTIDRIERYVEERGIAGELSEARPVERFDPGRSTTELDLRAEGIGTVVWATGYSRNYSWLDVPVLDGRGEIEHVGGVTRAPGLYALGLRFQRRRNSSFIDGVGADAAALAEDIVSRLYGPRSVAA